MRTTLDRKSAHPVMVVSLTSEGDVIGSVTYHAQSVEVTYLGSTYFVPKYNLIDSYLSSYSSPLDYVYWCANRILKFGKEV